MTLNIKVKTFTAILSWDSSWTGGNVQHYDAYKSIDKKINEFVQEHNLEIVKVDHTEKNGYRQHGPVETNRDIYTQLISVLYYKGDLNIYKCRNCNDVVVEEKHQICKKCDKEEMIKWEEFTGRRKKNKIKNNEK